jgi:hypothetical protein
MLLLSFTHGYSILRGPEQLDWLNLKGGFSFNLVFEKKQFYLIKVLRIDLKMIFKVSNQMIWSLGKNSFT